MNNAWFSVKVKIKSKDTRLIATTEENITLNDAINWCKDNFGGDMTINSKWYWTYNHTFHFRDSRDATIFSLRWG